MSEPKYVNLDTVSIAWLSIWTVLGVSSTHNNKQKLQENVKSDTRKLLKHLKKNNLKMKKKQHTQNKKTLMLKT